MSSKESPITITGLTAIFHQTVTNVTKVLNSSSPPPSTTTTLLTTHAPQVIHAPTASALNGKAVAEPVGWNLIELTSISTVLVVLILACIVGNLLVILAILLERDLRNRPQYYLIFSLAVADLIVGLIVTPLGAWSTVTRAWRLGVTLCDFWISVDVLVCTASILHLVAIALDRYWSVTDICYVQNRTPRRIFGMLATIWTLSLLISLAPIAGWKDDDFQNRVERDHICLISQQISYQVFSTATAFYIPLCAIICVYWKIMRAAKRRFKRERDRRTVNRPPPIGSVKEKKAPSILKKYKKAPPPPAVVLPQEKIGEGQEMTNNGSELGTPDGNSQINNGTAKKGRRTESSSSTMSDDERTPMKADGDESVETKLDIVSTDVGNGRATPALPQSASAVSVLSKPANGNEQKTSIAGILPKRKRRVKESAETRRERKAWRTLAIITGTFVACWTPFFLVSLYRPLCGCHIPTWLESITAWLGYLNSALNPIIYTVFSLDFRLAFKRILKRICFINER